MGNLRGPLIWSGQMHWFFSKILFLYDVVVLCDNAQRATGFWAAGIINDLTGFRVLSV